MGFRGEALASIAAISHAHVRTRTRDDDSGYEVSVGGRDAGPPRPCAAAVGTTVTVRDLFFNTPARRKFLRTSNTEAAHVAEQIARLSIPYPQVAFTLTRNGRRTIDLPASDSTRLRIGDLFTPDLAEALLAIGPRGGDVKVSGLIAPPSAARSSGKWQYFFLNGRYIRDRLLSHALREAYRGAAALLVPNVEDFGMVAVEALACGTPAVGLSASGTADVIRPGREGELADEGTVDALVDAARRALEQRYDPAQLRQRAQVFSRERFLLRFRFLLDRLGFGKVIG